jgi:nitrate reductase (NAD(P)H)
MPSHNIPWDITVKDHPGSSQQDIRDEPDWAALHAHQIGFKNHDGRRPGLTHFLEHEEEIEVSRRMREDLHHRESTGDLVNFRDLIENQEDFHLRYPGNRSLGWRYVLETTEDWVKNQQKWPANLEKWEKEKEKAGKKEGDDQGQKDKDSADAHKEKSQKDEQESKQEEKPELSPQERSLLETLERDARCRANLKVNDGKQKCPQTHNRSSITIDEQDQFTPDNWQPRCPDLIRLTGKHPMNAEPPLARLFDGGLITPNELHFVRNHGSVPRLLWEFHRLDITTQNNATTLSLTMNDLKTRYPDAVINIPVTMACTGNRRKELDLVRKTKGFNNGAASVGTAYWKGPTLRAVLLAAGIPATSPSGKKLWLNFAGADSPSEGTYETSLPLDYAMDAANDVLLAMYMNDLPLPPDHGYPVRLIIPGYVGGRCVKWLRRIWVSEQENQSYYHIWDNRVLPSFVRDKEGELARALFQNPSTACNEGVLNSVVCKPAQGERIVLSDVKKGTKYRVRGFAFNGAGHEVQQVEVSLDEGKSWLFAAREFPEYPVRHGNKFWAWVFWDVEVELADLVKAPGVVVRCSGAGKNMQPKEFQWNVMGMMNNSWYTVKAEIELGGEDHSPAVVFKHPTEAGASTGGWMQPSEELRVAQAKQDAATPQKQFTREEIEKHDKEDDCWIVVDNKVFDVSSVLAWHPGGKTAIMSHAGKCHPETTEEFSSIHDDYGYQKLQGAKPFPINKLPR